MRRLDLHLSVYSCISLTSFSTSHSSPTPLQPVASLLLLSMSAMLPLPQGTGSYFPSAWEAIPLNVEVAHSHTFCWTSAMCHPTENSALKSTQHLPTLNSDTHIQFCLLIIPLNYHLNPQGQDLCFVHCSNPSNYTNTKPVLGTREILGEWRNTRKSRCPPFTVQGGFGILRMKEIFCLFI